MNLRYGEPIDCTGAPTAEDKLPMADDARTTVWANADADTLRVPTRAETFRRLQKDALAALMALEEFARRMVSERAHHPSYCRSWQELRRHLVETDNELRAWRE